METIHIIIEKEKDQRKRDHCGKIRGRGEATARICN